jgi:hypothetical protein
MLCGTPTIFRHPARKSVRDCAVVRLCAEEGAPGRRFSGTRHCTPVAREWMCVHLPVAAGWARVHRVSCAILPHGCGAGRLSCPFKSLFRVFTQYGGTHGNFPGRLVCGRALWLARSGYSYLKSDNMMLKSRSQRFHEVSVP